MLIGELAKKSGVSRDTIRYYEKLGMFGSVNRTEGNYREYAEDTELVLRFIRICKTLGFTLREIKQYIDDIMGGHLTFGDLRAVIHTKIDAYMNEMELLTEKITKLESILQNCPTRLSVMDAIDKKQQSEVSA